MTVTVKGGTAAFAVPGAAGGRPGGAGGPVPAMRFDFAPGGGVFLPSSGVGVGVTVITLVALLALGALAASAGGASPVKGALRVTVWGAAAMALSALVGSLFGVKA